MKITFSGSAKHVSTEQFRSFVYASLMLLAFHKRTPPPHVTIKLSKTLERSLMGRCRKNDDRALIEIRHNLDHDKMLTTVFHEIIHCCFDFEMGADEACTTQLNAELKPTVIKLADILADNVYRRAAFIAHTQIHYPKLARKVGDYYDPAEYLPTQVTPRNPRIRNNSRLKKPSKP
ncbi:MAG: hypothetical protein RIS76_3304 [Verrucomicrobiota bacterium]|jgi:hypothetical protein